MHKPVNPCRRTCSTFHSPENQAHRYNEEKLRRLHQSETKIMIVQKPPIRVPTPQIEEIMEVEPDDYRAIDY